MTQGNDFYQEGSIDIVECCEVAISLALLDGFLEMVLNELEQSRLSHRDDVVSLKDLRWVIGTELFVGHQGFDRKIDLVFVDGVKPRRKGFSKRNVDRYAQKISDGLSKFIVASSDLIGKKFREDRLFRSRSR